MAFNIARFYKQDRLEYQVEIITPMFLAGADQSKAELRAASLKGLLRYWWRAVCTIDNVDELRAREKILFGSAETNKSQVCIAISNAKVNRTKDSKLPHHTYELKKQDKIFKLNILDYLAYGTQKGAGNVFIRERIEPGSSFKIIMDLHDSNHAEVISAFESLVTYGGIGSRQKNGFGSLHVDGIVQNMFISRRNLGKFPSFSDQSKLFLFSQHNSWHDALAEIGLAYRDARLSLEPKHSFEKRSLISAPLMDNKTNKAFLERHAKPYFLHVRKINGRYQGQILFLPYRYLFGNPAFSQAPLNKYLEACGEMNLSLSSKSREVLPC